MGRDGRDLDDTGRQDPRREPAELSRGGSSPAPEPSRHTPGDKAGKPSRTTGGSQKLSREAGASSEDQRVPHTPSRSSGAQNRLHARVSDDVREATDSLWEPGGKREVYELRNVRYRLNDAQADALRAVGAFRTVPADALIQNVYGGDSEAFEGDLRQLRRQELVTVSTREGRANERFVSLTPAAKDLTDARLKANPEQRLYAGALKHRELDHDAALYAMYHKGLERIAQEGGRPTRVILDYELKERINKDLVAAKALPAAEQAPKLREIAKENDLKVIEDHIPLPDVRIEYETRDGDKAHLDLEYVTPNYHAETIAEKARAGFTLYGDGGAAGRRVRDEYPSLAAQILSL